MLPQIVDGFCPHWALKLTNEEYHADHTAVGSTNLRQILESPYAFWCAHTRRFPRVETKAFQMGTAVHMALGEPEEFKRRFVLMPDFSGTGAVLKRKEWVAEQASDAVIMKEDDYNDLQEMVNSVQRHESASMLLRKGQAETSGYFTDPDTSIKCKIRPDFLRIGPRIALIDIKTTPSVNPREFSNSIAKYGYDFQMAMYTRGVSAIEGRPVDLPLFLCVQKQAPFEVALYEADLEMMLNGETKFKQALTILKECLIKNEWPTIQTGGYSKISLPKWALVGEQNGE